MAESSERTEKGAQRGLDGDRIIRLPPFLRHARLRIRRACSSFMTTRS